MGTTGGGDAAGAGTDGFDPAQDTSLDALPSFTHRGRDYFLWLEIKPDAMDWGDWGDYPPDPEGPRDEGDDPQTPPVACAAGVAGGPD